MKTLTTLALATLALAALAGCSASNGPTGQSATAPGTLAYNGTGAGTDADTFQCPSGTGQLSLGANLGSGSVSITVSDGSAQGVYSRTATGPGQTSDSREVHGGSGAWKVSATRSPTFSGQYSVSVSC